MVIMGAGWTMLQVQQLSALHKIEQRQKHKTLKALKIIHSHNILHNNIREENILVNEKGEIYIIDFGLSITTGNREQFCEEERELSNLLDRYM